MPPTRSPCGITRWGARLSAATVLLLSPWLPKKDRGHALSYVLRGLRRSQGVRFTRPLRLPITVTTLLLLCTHLRRQLRIKASATDPFRGGATVRFCRTGSPCAITLPCSSIRSYTPPSTARSSPSRLGVSLRGRASPPFCAASSPVSTPTPSAYGVRPRRVRWVCRRVWSARWAVGWATRPGVMFSSRTSMFFTPCYGCSISLSEPGFIYP